VEELATTVPEDDIEAEEDEAAEEDTFLEEEEHSEEVSTLKDGGVEGDEER
jgi:hypothetical protein